MKNQSFINFGNPLINIVGNEHMDVEPSREDVLEELLNSMAEFNGVCWAPVKDVVDGETVSWTLMLNQCPGACGRVWSLVIKNKDVKSYLVNEINKRRQK